MSIPLSPTERPVEPEARLQPTAEWHAAQRFLLEHLRPSGNPAGLRRPRAAQWQMIGAEARRHRLAPLAYRRLAGGPWRESIPVDTLTMLREAYHLNALRNAALMREVAWAVAGCADRGIPVLLLKGQHLAACVYSEPGLRSMADLDFLVPRDRLEAAEAVFVENGYGPLPRAPITALPADRHHLERLDKPGVATVELHFTIANPTMPFRIDVEGLWQRSREVRLGVVETRVLSDEDLLLHLALHLAHHHGFGRSALKGLVDIATLIEARRASLQWSVVVERANAWGIGRFAYCALMVAQNLLGAGIPPHALPALTHDAEDEAVATAASRFVLSLPSDLPVRWRHMAAAPGVVERARLLRRSVFPPLPVLRTSYGTRGNESAILLYGRRLVDLFHRRGRNLARVMLRMPSGRRLTERVYDEDRIVQWVTRYGGRQG